jgi:transposase
LPLIVAPCVIDGPVNGLSFTAWVSQFLAPTPSRGDIVIADNLGSHKGRSVRAALRAVGVNCSFCRPAAPT